MTTLLLWWAGVCLGGVQAAQARDNILQGSTMQVFTGPLSDKADAPLPTEMAALWKPYDLSVKNNHGKALTEVSLERLDVDKPATFATPSVPTSFWDTFTINKDPLQFRARLLALLATTPAGDGFVGRWTSAPDDPAYAMYERNLAARRAAAPDAALLAYDPTLPDKQADTTLGGQKAVAFKSVDGLRSEIARRLGADAEADAAAGKDPFKERHVYAVAWLVGRAPAFVPGTPPPVAVRPAPPAPAPRGNAATLLRFSGSNTIGGKLLPALAVAYLQKEGCANVRVAPSATEDESVVVGERGGQSVQIELRAHGSATAFHDLKASLCDIGMASRKIKPAERDDLLPSLGDLTTNAGEHVLALDGIAVIVHPASPLRALSVPQLASLFSGEITDWSAVGGRSGPVSIYARDGKSGTWDFFNDAVLKSHGKTLVPAARRFEDSTKLSEAVTADPGGIGFIGLNYVGSNKLLAVSDQGVSARRPTLLTVKTLDYLLARQLYLYTAVTPTNPNVERFIEFALGNTAQPVVESVGLVNLDLNPITKPGEIDPGDPRNTSADWRRLTAGATEIPTRYRFRTGSSELDPKGNRDIGRIVGVLSQPQYKSKRVILVGFADASGTPAGNQKLSRDRTDIVKNELVAEGLEINQVVGLGAQAFVAPNDTTDNKEKNRRVEVWVK